jgi:hypothetical protein
MRHARLCAFLIAVAAAVMIVSGGPAAPKPKEDERSYLPPETAREGAKAYRGETAPKAGKHHRARVKSSRHARTKPRHRTRTEAHHRRHRYYVGRAYGEPPFLFFVPDLLFGFLR